MRSSAEDEAGESSSTAAPETERNVGAENGRLQSDEKGHRGFGDPDEKLAADHQKRFGNPTAVLRQCFARLGRVDVEVRRDHERGEQVKTREPRAGV